MYYNCIITIYILYICIVIQRAAEGQRQADKKWNLQEQDL